MRGIVEQAVVLAAVVGVISVAGLPLTAVALPDRWRNWWPALLPLAGMVTLLCVVGTLNLLAPIDDLRPVLGALLLAGAAIAIWRRPRPMPRPPLAVWAAISVSLAAGLVAFSPSLDAGEPRPPAIVSADSFYYAVNAVWLQGNTSRAAAPDPRADSFFTPAFVGKQAPLTVGAEQIDAAVSTMLGIDAATALPAYTAALAAFGCLAIALLLAAFGLSPWLATAAAVLVAARAEGLRLALDEALAQLVGAAVLPIAIAATWRWIAGAGRAWLAWAALALAALVVAYPGYVPFAGTALAVAGVVSVGWLARVGVEGARTAVLVRMAVVAVVAVVLAVPHLPRSVHAAANVNDVAQLATGVFDPLATNVGVLMGSADVYAAPSALGALLAGLALAAGGFGLAALWRNGNAPIVAGLLVAIALYVLKLRVVDPYPHGLRKFLDLPGPMVAGAVVAAYGAAPRPWRIAVAVVGAALLITGAARQPDLVERALESPYSPTVAEIELRSDPALFPDGRSAIALTGTSHPNVPMGRVHWATYAMREGQLNPTGYDIHVSYLLSAAYENPKVYVPQSGDEAYRPDYAYVLSYGPSPTHRQPPYHQVGDYLAYRREPVDVLLAGWPWTAAVSSPDGPVWWWHPGGGAARLHVSTLEPRTARIRMRLVAPQTQRIRMRLDGRVVGQAILSPRARIVVTAPLRLEAGGHQLALEPVGGAPPAAGQPPQLGLLRAFATP